MEPPNSPKRFVELFTDVSWRIHRIAFRRAVHDFAGYASKTATHLGKGTSHRASSVASVLWFVHDLVGRTGW